MENKQNPNNRRQFIRKASLLGGLAALAAPEALAQLEPSGQVVDGTLLQFDNPPKSGVYKPLKTIIIQGKGKGELRVLDGRAQTYFKASFEGRAEFIAGGALGTHIVQLVDKKGRLLDQASFTVQTRTHIKDSGREFKRLLDTLYSSMIGEWGTPAEVVRFRGKYYHFFVRWLRDHVHTLKGMKYFYPELKSGIDLYADTQRPDGMIFDNIYPTEKPISMWKQRFDYGGFYLEAEKDPFEFKRIPVENDVEYLFIEGIYYTWKATGDDHWMKGLLDKALKAVEYSTTSEYRWSEKYQLLKRGYTIDTWDFQNDVDATLSSGPGNEPDPMVVKPGLTRFGIMYGDNTGFAIGCHYLAEMLQHAERPRDAERMTELGNSILQRLNELAWNGEFYTHHVPEDPSVDRSYLGVDEKSQVSLSNAYSINRGIGTEKAQNIIQSYQRIQRLMPHSSPGEWYTIYPPFLHGYGGHNSLWNYMNGGVTTIVAGELAHGAFENGFEEYGVDILKRIKALADRSEGHLHCTYRGAMPDRPATEFTPLNLAKWANADIKGDTLKGVTGWTNEGDNDLREFPTYQREFLGIPFDVVNPGVNGRKVALGLSTAEGYSKQEKININQKAKTLYLLHTTGQSYLAGSLTLHYADGSTHTEYIGPGKIMNWWYPNEPAERKQLPRLQVAWRGSNPKCLNIGVSLYGMANPQPDKIIKTIELEAARNGAKWMLLGLTLSNQEAYFEPD
ncbi:MAG: hypothetical protein HC842_03210, partial [Cytophagales bacterium]|nr:hypothetical protein [Cytophagales bacterium]